MSGDLTYSGSGGSTGGSGDLVYSSGSGSTTSPSSSLDDLASRNDSVLAYRAAKSAAIAEWNASNYNHSDINTYTSESFSQDNINTDNPYEQFVIVSSQYKYDVTGYAYQGRIYLPVLGNFRVEYTYGINDAYTAFEENIFEAQVSAYESDFNAQYVAVDTTRLSDTYDNYDNDRFGDTDFINSLSQSVYDLKTDIKQNVLEDSLSADYNRITNTSNSDANDSLNEDLDRLQKELAHAQAVYDNKQFQDELRRLREEEDRRATGDFRWSPIPIPPPPPPIAKYDPTYELTSSTEYLRSIQSADMHDWMAGGTLYDSPRAGDIFFNATGDLNTVKFLGLQDKNMNAILKAKFSSVAEVHKILNVSAGSDNFSIL
ncbi:MAG: hypothetical protein Q9M40_07090 [Sulfurimonas sp.]|nr:hypothetical protein [Sulfurimonas sp.]MDQ7067739.1 hypothetical protein [Sulfurimonas sp.]